MAANQLAPEQKLDFNPNMASKSGEASLKDLEYRVDTITSEVQKFQKESSELFLRDLESKLETIIREVQEFRKESSERSLRDLKSKVDTITSKVQEFRKESSETSLRDLESKLDTIIREVREFRKESSEPSAEDTIIIEVQEIRDEVFGIKGILGEISTMMKNSKLFGFASVTRSGLEGESWF